MPEVLLISGLEEREFSFTAQLLPLDRGILETIYFRAAGVASAEDLLAIYEKRYAGEPFVRLYQPGPRARPARRGAHQFLRYRRHLRRRDRPRGGGERHRQPGERRGRARRSRT